MSHYRSAALGSPASLRMLAHGLAAVGVSAALMISAACAGVPYGNDGEKKPGEQNPARSGPPFDK